MMTTTAIQKQVKAKHPPGFTEQLVLLLFSRKFRPKFRPKFCCVGSFISLGVPIRVTSAEFEGFEEANGFKGAREFGAKELLKGSGPRKFSTFKLMIKTFEHLIR